MAGIKGGGDVLEPICSRGDYGGRTVVMQAVGGRRRSSADGMVLFLLWLVFQAGSCWDLEAARPGPRQQWLPDAGLFGGIWLQEVVEREGGALPTECSIMGRVSTQWIRML